MADRMRERARVNAFINIVFLCIIIIIFFFYVTINFSSPVFTRRAHVSVRFCAHHIVTLAATPGPYTKRSVKKMRITTLCNYSEIKIGDFRHIVEPAYSENNNAPGVDTRYIIYYIPMYIIYNVIMAITCEYNFDVVCDILTVFYEIIFIKNNIVCHTYGVGVGYISYIILSLIT